MDVGVIPHHQRWSIFWDFNIFKKNCAVLHFKLLLLKQSGAKNKSRADGSILWLRGVCYYLRKTCHFVQNTQNTIINPGMFFVLFLWFNLVPPQPKCQTPYSPLLSSILSSIQLYISLIVVVQQFPGLLYLHVVFPPLSPWLPLIILGLWCWPAVWRIIIFSLYFCDDYTWKKEVL